MNSPCPRHIDNNERSLLGGGGGGGGGGEEHCMGLNLGGLDLGGQGTSR